MGGGSAGGAGGGAAGGVSGGSAGGSTDAGAFVCLRDLQAPRTFLATGPIRRLLSADLDDNGRSDLVTLSSAGAEVFLSLGDGRFMLNQTISGANFYDVVARDFDRDGDLDLVFLQAQSNSFAHLYRGAGNGTFTFHVAQSVGANASALAAADFTGDLFPDLIVSLSNSSMMSLAVNDGGPNFAVARIFPAGALGPFRVVTTDFNRDGRPDYAVNFFTQPGVTNIALGDGDGGFVDAGFLVGANTTSGLATGDLNADGWPDLVIGHRWATRMGVVLSVGDGGFAAPVFHLLPGEPVELTLADLSGDGRLDVAVAVSTGTQGVVVFHNQGNGALQPLPMIPAGDGPFDVVSGSFDSDPFPDLAVANSTSGTVTVYLNGCLPNFAFATSGLVNGNLGGVSGADSFCQAAARDAGLPGTYRALLFEPDGGLQTRLQGASGWVRTDRLPYAVSLADLTARHVAWPLLRTERGGAVSAVSATIWAGAGGNESAQTCSGWMTTAGTGATENLAEPSSQGLQVCSSSQRLACLGVDQSNPAWIPRVRPSRLAFVSEQPFSTGGLAAADALCRGEAGDAGLPGTFAALLATSTASAAARFDAGVAWVRVDGVTLAASPADVVAGRALGVSLNLNVRGEVVSSAVWTGASTPQSTAAACADWTSDAGVGGQGQSASLTTWWDGGVGACGSPARVYCFQQ